MSNTVCHRRLGGVTILERRPNLVCVVPAGGEPVWVKPCDLSDDTTELNRQRAAAREQLRTYDQFALYLRAHADEAFVYFSYPQHAAGAVDKILADIGQAGVDHAPIKLGARGGKAGHDAKYSYSFMLKFKRPADLNIIPRGIHYLIEGGMVVICNTAYAIELAKVCGLRVTNRKEHRERKEGFDAIT